MRSGRYGKGDGADVSAGTNNGLEELPFSQSGSLMQGFSTSS